MIVKMNLEHHSFEKMQTGSKDIEMRLNDEKRRLIAVGDTIVFTNLTTRERLHTQVVALHLFDSFASLYQAFDPKRLGYDENQTPSPQDMERYYDQMQVAQFGVLGIEIRCIEAP